MKPVRTKADFVTRYQQGEFGNRPPTWNTFKEWCDDHENHDNLFHLRNRIAGGETFYHLNNSQLYEKWRDQKNRSQWYCSVMVPHHLEKRLFVQGEVRRSTNYLDLFCSNVPLPMRDSLAVGGRQLSGIMAASILRTHLTPTDHDWIQYLLDEYEDHVIEFSSYEMPWGTVPHSNTIIWEVRNY